MYERRCEYEIVRHCPVSMERNYRWLSIPLVGGACPACPPQGDSLALAPGAPPVGERYGIHAYGLASVDIRFSDAGK